MREEARFRRFIDKKQCLLHLEEHSHNLMHSLASKPCLGHFLAPPPIRKGYGARSESRTCEIVPCPIDCVFEDWSSWSVCDESCARRPHHAPRPLQISGYYWIPCWRILLCSW